MPSRGPRRSSTSSGLSPRRTEPSSPVRTSSTRSARAAINRASVERVDLVTVVGDDEDTGALGNGHDDFAGEAEAGGLVRRNVADDEGAAAVGQGLEDAAE